VTCGSAPSIFLSPCFQIGAREYGGVAGSYVEMWEFKSIQEMEKVTATMMKNKEMKDIDTEFHKLIDHTTFTQSLWNTVA
jgi:hypothetical protein